jgi:hypothetical protein
MKTSWSTFALLLVLSLPLSGCQIVADIFRAGVVVGVVLVLLVLGLIVWLLSRSTS